MHTTFVKMKDGTEFHGVIWLWRPWLGWVELRNVGPVEAWSKIVEGSVSGAMLVPDIDTFDIRVEFDEVESMVTPKERVTVEHYADVDELAKAQRQMVEARYEALRDSVAQALADPRDARIKELEFHIECLEKQLSRALGS